MKHDFVIPKCGSGCLETLESNGRKFHFISQSSREGQSLVSSMASKHGLKDDQASLMVSQIKFTVCYSQEEKPIFVIFKELNSSSSNSAFEDQFDSKFEATTEVQVVKMKIKKMKGIIEGECK